MVLQDDSTPLRRSSLCQVLTNLLLCLVWVTLLLVGNSSAQTKSPIQRFTVILQWATSSTCCPTFVQDLLSANCSKNQHGLERSLNPTSNSWCLILSWQAIKEFRDNKVSIAAQQLNSWLLCFWSRSLLMGLGGSGWWQKYLNHCHPCGRLTWNSRLLVLAWPSLHHCREVHQQMKKHLSLSFPLSLSHFL